MPQLVAAKEAVGKEMVAVAANENGHHSLIAPGAEMATGSRLERFVWQFTELHVRRPLASFCSCFAFIIILVKPLQSIMILSVNTVPTIRCAP